MQAPSADDGSDEVALSRVPHTDRDFPASIGLLPQDSKQLSANGLFLAASRLDVTCNESAPLKRPPIGNRDVLDFRSIGHDSKPRQCSTAALTGFENRLPANSGLLALSEYHDVIGPSGAECHLVTRQSRGDIEAVQLFDLTHVLRICGVDSFSRHGNSYRPSPESIA